MRLGLVVVAAIAITSVADRAEACSCSAISVEDAFSQSDVVLRAVVAEEHALNGTACDASRGDDVLERRALLLDVQEVFKGLATTRVFVVDATATCASGLNVGAERILFLSAPVDDDAADPLAGAFGVGSCTTMLTSAAALPPGLADNSREPQEGSDAPPCFEQVNGCSAARANVTTSFALLALLALLGRRRSIVGQRTRFMMSR